MKINSILMLGLIASLFFSCQTKTEKPIEQNTFRAEFVDNIKLSEYFTSLEYVFLEESPDGLFINADKIIFFQKRWYILDSELMAILCFDENGKFLFRIHSVGRGPGEYQLLTGIMIHETNKELWAQCRKSTKIFIYNLDGQLIREESVGRVGIDLIQMNESDILAYDEERHYFHKDNAINSGVYLFDYSFRRKHQLFELPSGTMYYALNNNNNFSLHKDSCFFLSPSDSLICFPPDLNPVVIGVFDFGTYHLSEKLKHLPNKVQYFSDVIDSGKVIWKEKLVVTSQAVFLQLGLQNSSWFGIIDRKNSRFRVTQGIINDLDSRVFIFPSFRKSRTEVVGFISADLLLAYQESISMFSDEDKEMENTKAMIAFIERGLEGSGNVLVISKIKEQLK